VKFLLQHEAEKWWNYLGSDSELLEFSNEAKAKCKDPASEAVKVYLKLKDIGRLKIFEIEIALELKDVPLIMYDN